MSEKLFFKENHGDKIWTYFDGSTSGPMISFDKKTVLHLYSDFPDKFTDEQIELFCKERPYWAEYFADRISMDNLKERKNY